MPAEITLQCSHAMVKLLCMQHSLCLCSVMVSQPAHQHSMATCCHSPDAAFIPGTEGTTYVLYVCICRKSTHILHEIGGMLLAADFAHVWHAKDANNLALQHNC